MNLVRKIIGNFNWFWKGCDCQRDLEAGMPDRDLIKKYGNFTVSKVRESMDK